MDKIKPTRYPAEVLSLPARPVERIDEGVRRLVELMTQVMVENRGVGLAAPQISVPLRLFIVSTDGSAESIRIYVNPKVEPYGALHPAEEGCLSVPGVSTKISRHERCKVVATDLEGRPFEEDAEGLLARILQHEADHLEGVTIVNRMTETARISHRKQLRRLAEDAAVGG